jgi:hypothetical protein
MRKYQCFVMMAGAVLSSLLLTGCLAALVAGAAAGAGAVAYGKGELKATEAVSLDRAWSATQQAFEELELLGEGKEKDALSARIEAQGVDDKRIVVRLRRIDPELTEIRIRVGVLGNEPYSRLIYDQIRSGF